MRSEALVYSLLAGLGVVVHGVFKYASDKLVYINHEDVSCYSPVLSKETEQYVLEHPEEFILIELVYD